MTQKLPQNEHWPVVKIVGIYTLFGTLWIYFSDTILGWMVRDPDMMTRIAIYKGMMYIFLTAALLYVLIYRHVYKEKLSRQQVEANEKKMRLFFDLQLIGMAITSPEKGWMQVNQKLCSMTGYSGSELYAMTWEQITHPDDLARSNLMFKRLLAGEIDTYTFEKRYIRKDGSVLYTDLSVGCVRCQDGSVDYVLSLLVDITERKLAEAALRESEEMFSKAFNSAPVMMMISELGEGAYLDVNSSFLELAGYSRDEVIGRTPVELGWTSAGEWQKVCRELESQQRCSNMELITTTSTGQTLECLFYGEQISVGGRQRLLSIMLDITEHRKLEKKLRQAMKMESIGRLAGGVAHDFNNKLSVILGYAEMARNMMPENSRIDNYLEEISKAAMHSRDVTRQLLAFSRQDMVMPKQIDLNEVIRDSRNALSSLIGEDIQIVYNTCEDLWKVRIDPAQIDQIIMNLAVNARDAMPDGGIFSIAVSNMTITEQCLPEAVEARPGDFVCISFTDNGIGIDKEIIRNIFEPFFTTKEVGKGTGLGLATIYGIVSQNSGFIEVISMPGYGTTFNIFLPRLEGEETVETNGTVSRASGTGRILVVEDEESVRLLIIQMLGRLGYEVLSAKSPLDAIELFKTCQPKPDLVLSDVIMPGMSGREMMNIINSVHQEVKVLYISGYTSDIISQKGIFAENINFLQKPFSISMLNEAIKKVLSN